MQVKKNPKANLENYSKLFMQLGLVLALLVVYLAIKKKTFDRVIDTLADATYNIEDEEQTIEIEQPKPPEPKTPPPPTPDKIEIVDEKVNERITPQVHTNTETRTIKKKNGKDKTVTQSNTYVTEDIDVYMNNQFQADLIDVTTNKVAWKGYSTTSAQVNMIGMDIETIIEKFAESVIEEMKAKGHIK